MIWTTIVIAHRLSTIKTANLIVVLQAGKVVESGLHNELMQINGGQGGEYSKMVQLQQVDIPNEASNTPSSPVEGRNHHKMSIPSSPISGRSSTRSSPNFISFSQAFTLGTPYSYSIQYDPDGDSDGKYGNNSTNPPPSQWRLLKMNAPEWGKAVLGCLGALGSGAVQPINAYCVGLLIYINLFPP